MDSAAAGREVRNANEYGTRIAEREIGQVLKHYCRSMDRIDPEQGYTVWHDDALVDYSPLFHGTGRGFIDWVCDAHRKLDAQSHLIGNCLIDIRGERRRAKPV